MAERFNLTAQIQLQAPRNTKQVVGDIRKQLSGITIDVQVKGNARSLAQINKQMQGVDKAAASSANSVNKLNRNLSEAARRFSIITVATGTMLALARAVKNAVGEAIAFERELIKISQVTGKTVGQLQGLSGEVTKLATSLGASSADLLNVARVLNQAGFAAEKTKQALDILAKTSLGATFNNIQDTTEGAIAVLRQFGNEAKSVGGDIKFLEQTMDAINAVSKKFAVESGDLITVIRRVGGVFEAAGGGVNELIALFTSVRATTRESAETISTGLRTIFTRIQRTDTVDQLAALGIQLRDSEGQFVGAFEAVKRLSQGLKGLNPKDFRFSEIVESLGGFRQIGKVIPLIRQFTTAQDALNVAQSASGSVSRDAITAQKSLAVQATRVREEFSAMVRSLTDSSTFRSVAKGALEMASAFIRIVEALEPLLPLLTSMIALKIGSALAPGLGALTGIGPKRKAAGGRIHGYARGGFVPGSGNGDTVPAMLQPGEFVIKKSSANKLGAGTLESMNQNRFRLGGRNTGRLAKKAQDVRRGDVEFKTTKSKPGKETGLGEVQRITSQIDQIETDNVYGGAFLRDTGSGQMDVQGKLDSGVIQKKLQENKTFKLLKSTKGTSPLRKAADKMEKEATGDEHRHFKLLARSLNKDIGEKAESKIYDGVLKAVGKTGKFLQRSTGAGPPSQTTDQILANTNIDNVVGNLFEASLLESGAPFNPKDRDSANAPFDFPGGLGAVASGFQGGADIAEITSDAKTGMTSGNIKSFLNKAKNEKTNQFLRQLDTAMAQLTPDDVSGQFASRGKGVSSTKNKSTNAADLRKRVAAVQNKAYGGKIDSVPALLTPGEFVVKKSSAQNIGYGNLNKMNQTGVKRFAAGGRVGFAEGGAIPGSGGGTVDTSAIKAAVANAAADLETGAVKAVISEALVNYSSDIVKPVIDEAAVNYSSDTVKAVIAEAVVNYSSDVVKAVIAEAAVNYSSDAVKAVIAEAAVNYSSDAVKAVIAEAVINYSSDAVKPVIAEALINYSSDAVKAVIAEASVNMSTDSVKAVIDEAAINMSTDSVKAVIDEAAVNMSTDSVKAVIDEAAVNMSTDSVKAVIDEAATNFNTDEIRAKVEEAATSLDGLSEKLDAVPEPTAAPDGAPPAPTTEPATEVAARTGPKGAALGLDTAPGSSGGDLVPSAVLDASLDAVEQALGKVGVGGDKMTTAMLHVHDTLRDGVSPAQAFDDAFDDMRDGIDAAKKAAEDQAAAEAAAKKKGGPGDVTGADVDKFGVDRDALTVGKPSDASLGLGAGAKEDAGLRDELKRIQKAEIASIQKKIRETEEGVSAMDALTRANDVVRDKYGVLAKELEESAKAQDKAQKATKAMAKKQPGKLAKGLGAIGKGAQSVEGAAGAAQQFGMMAAMVGGTIIQMSGLSDATKQAATETLGFAAGIMGVGGTVIQMLGSMAQMGQASAVSSALSAAADTGEGGASTTAAGADVVEAGASMAAAGPLLILVAIVGGVILALKYFSAQAKAEADALAKGRKENLDKIAAGKGGSAESAKQSVGGELDLRDSSDALSNAMYGAGIAATGSAAAFAVTAAAGAAAGGSLIAAGAAFGSVIPIVGTVVGALVGAGIAYWLSTRVVTEEALARQKMVDGIYGSIDTFARLADSGNKFDDAMADLGQLKLPDTKEGKTEQISRELEITSNLDTTGVGAEFDKLGELASKTGVGFHSLTEAGLIEKFGEGSAELIAFQEATRASKEGMGNLAKKTAAARATLQKAADLEITGDLSFDEILAQGGPLAKAFKASNDAIRAEGQARIDEAQAAKKAAETNINKATSEGDFVAADAARVDLSRALKDGSDAQNRMNSRLKDSKEALDMQAEAAIKTAEAERQAAAAAQALAEQLQKTSDFMKALSGIEFAQGQQTKSLDNRLALQSGGKLNFSRDVEGLGGESTMIRDIAQFEKDMDVAIGELPAGLQREARKQVKIVTESTRVFNEGKKKVTAEFSQGKISAKFGDKEIEDLIRKAGLDPDDLKDRDLFKGIAKDIKEKAKDGITNAEFDEIFEPIKTGADAAQASLQKINELRNNDIANYGKYLSGISAQRDKELESRKNVLKVQQQGEELMAKARGGELTAGQKDTHRTGAAQLALRGTGVQAGDAGGAARAASAAKRRLEMVEKEIRSSKVRGAALKKLQREEMKLNDTIKKTTAELERLADQSDKASDILAQIDKEKAKRETVVGILGDFVKGGDSERRAITDALMGVQSAVTTGTVQNQTPEQRGATFDMLDKLSDIEIAGTGGLTGKDVKQELIFRDAIQMGLDPAIAEKLATATSKEEQLIQALDRLTQQMAAAANAKLGLDQQGGLFAQGGLIYRAGGGDIFQPKGTDTVPAMLTPGEFVVKKSAVKNIGMGTLKAINSGRYAKGGPVGYYQQGGAAIQSTQGNLATQGAIKIPTGEQIKKTFREGVMSLGPGGFLKIIHQVYGGDAIDANTGDKISKGKTGREVAQMKKRSKTIAGALSRLMKSGKLDLTKLSFPDSFAGYVDKVLANKDILERVDASGVTFKSDPLITSPARTSEGKDQAIKRAKAYRTRLSAMSMSIDASTNLGNKINVTDQVFQRTQGFSPWENVSMFGREAFSRTQALGHHIDRLENWNLNKPIESGMGGMSVGVGGTMDKKGDALTGATGKTKADLELLIGEGVLKMATGGNVPGLSDTVPAMLTPGEFVMSKSAVQQHGIGYMKSLNRGRVPGFNRGGVVGRGNVQYKTAGGGIDGNGGGVISLDPARLQGVLDTFNTSFSASIDKIAAPFTSVSESLGRVAEAFGAMTMTHTFSGNIAMSVNIGNKDAIIAAVSEGIKPTVSELITNQVNKSIDELKSEASG